MPATARSSSAPPLPGRLEGAGPHATPAARACVLSRDVVERVPAVGERQALSHEPFVDVDLADETTADDPPVAVDIALVTGDGAPSDQILERQSSPLTAAPFLAGLSRQVWLPSGASMPWSRMRWPWISMVSASITEATPTVSAYTLRRPLRSQSRRAAPQIGVRWRPGLATTSSGSLFAESHCGGLAQYHLIRARLRVRAHYSRSANDDIFNLKR